jgi:hypothetical protein
MMNNNRSHSFSLLLYSNFSQNSAIVRSKIQTSGINFKQLVGLRELCIDMKKVRETIVNNSKIQVSIVPCLLIGYSDGMIEKYEDQNLHDWVDEIIRINNKTGSVITTPTPTSTPITTPIITTEHDNVDTNKISSISDSSSFSPNNPKTTYEKIPITSKLIDENDIKMHEKLMEENRKKYEKTLINKDSEKTHEEVKITKSSNKPAPTKSILEIARDMENTR